MLKRTLFTALAAAGTLAFTASAQAAYLNMGASNTYTAATTLTGSIAGPALTVKNGYGTSASAYGLYGLLTNTAPSANAAAIRGLNSSTNGFGIGVWGQQNGGGTGVYGLTTSGKGVYGNSANGTGVYGAHAATSGTAPGVRGTTSSTAGGSAGVFGSSASSNAFGFAGVLGETPSTSFNWGVAGRNPGATSVGVLGCSDYGTGASDFLNNCLFGLPFQIGGTGGMFIGNGTDSPFGMGVRAIGRGSNGIGIDATGATAGNFNGNVAVTGNLNVTGAITAGTKDFRIDDPLDPAHKYLVHTSIESSQMMNIYNGNVVTDARGFATVRMPSWFQAVNRSFRYQLTVLGHSFARAIVWKPVHNNGFTIRTDRPRVKVSWQVAGIRHDRYANAHRTQVVVPKTGAANGNYLHPELYGKPASKAIYGPQMMRRGPYRVPTRVLSH